MGTRIRLCIHITLYDATTDPEVIWHDWKSYGCLDAIVSIYTTEHLHGGRPVDLEVEEK